MAVIFSDFDSRAFGFPFYRVQTIGPHLADSLRALDNGAALAVDAKAAADDLASARVLMNCGFRKVCMQITLRHDVQRIESLPPEVTVADRLSLTDDVLWRHARNFTADRFSLDPLLPAEGRQRMYRQWLENSLGGGKRVAAIGHNICTFSRQGQEVVIDLVSILDQRQGVGTKLIRAVVATAAAEGASGVRVTTECENIAAWKLYQREGFRLEAFTCAFHLVK